MKLDLKKELKQFYNAPSKDPVFVTLPSQKIIAIDGQGNPNTSIDFKNAVEALYPVAYKIKFAYKKLGKDYAVMPLEGLWWMDDMKDFTVENKDLWKWKIFIVQPAFVTKEMFDSVIEEVKSKKDLVSLHKVTFEILEEGLCAQILYVGAYKDEGKTIENLHAFIKNKGYTLVKKHHEIYLSDMRKTAPEKLKTILRQPIIKMK
jgi:hypothetical protein